MKSILKGKVLAGGAALLLMVGGCTSATTEDAATSSPVPSVTAGASSGDVAFGEWAAFADGVSVMVLAPQEFTPSEDVYAQPIWGDPVELDEWDHFVRTTVTVRVDPGEALRGPPFVRLAEASYADEMADKSVEYQGIVDEASGIEEFWTVWNSQEQLHDGQQITYDVGFGIDVGAGIEVPDGVRISVQMGDGFNGETIETIVFGSPSPMASATAANSRMPSTP